MTCSDIIRFMEQTAPPHLAEDWDNVGLLTGSMESKVERILLCLDVTKSSVDAAVENGADMIISHHPVIFGDLKRLTEDDSKGSLLCLLIRKGINIYAAHTNLDYALSGANSCLVDMLGLKDMADFGDCGGKVGALADRISLGAFIGEIKRHLTVPYVRLVGKADKGVQKVAVFCGSFDDDLDSVLKTGADVLVTGDVKYHTAIDAREAGLSIVDAGHFNTEKIVLPRLAVSLKNEFPAIGVSVFDGEEDPFKSC